jgi:aryl-alcohol dehydrogenase-like predicted oxidoreductase
LAEPAVSTVLTGASSPEQIAANARAAAWALTAEEIGEVRAMMHDGADD